MASAIEWWNRFRNLPEACNCVEHLERVKATGSVKFNSISVARNLAKWDDEQQALGTSTLISQHPHFLSPSMTSAPTPQSLISSLPVFLQLSHRCVNLTRLDPPSLSCLPRPPPLPGKAWWLFCSSRRKRPARPACPAAGFSGEKWFKWPGWRPWPWRRSLWRKCKLFFGAHWLK